MRALKIGAAAAGGGAILALTGISLLDLPYIDIGIQGGRQFLYQSRIGRLAKRELINRIASRMPRKGINIMMQYICRAFATHHMVSGMPRGYHFKT